jgi:hypothetical protein
MLFERRGFSAMPKKLEYRKGRAKVGTKFTKGGGGKGGVGIGKVSGGG